MKLNRTWHTGWDDEGALREKWQNETDNLRKMVLDCDLVEELKWGKPCFIYQKKTVAIIIPLKDAARSRSSSCRAKGPGREAGEDAGSAAGEVCANDLCHVVFAPSPKSLV